MFSSFLCRRFGMLNKLLPHEVPAPAKEVSKDIEDLHRIACTNGQETYLDPDSGYQVFTALSHLRRGKCCGSACRHCPFAHVAVKSTASRWRSNPNNEDANVK